MTKALDLRPDGTVVIRDDNAEWTLRRPVIGEWRVLLAEVDACDDQVRRAALDDQGAPLTDTAELVRRQTAIIRGTADTVPLWAAMMARIIDTLGGGVTPVDPLTLPAWCASVTAVQEIIGHWRAVPLDLSPMGAG